MRRSIIGTALFLGALAAPASAQHHEPVERTLNHESERHDHPHETFLDEPVHLYEIAFGVSNHYNAPDNLRTLRHTNTLGYREIRRAKHSIDNLSGLVVHTLSDHTSFGDSTINRLGGLLLITGTVAVTSHWAHEDAGHWLSYGDGGIARTPEERFHRTRTYALIQDQVAGGLNESEHHFFDNLLAAHRSKLTLNNAISSVAAKLDPIIQWVYSYHFAPRPCGCSTLVEHLDAHAPPGIINSIGLGDNRAYITILEQVDGASKEKDLYATLISAIANPHIWQSIALPLDYLINGTTTHDIWELELGPIGLRPPSLGIYRLPYGYYGRIAGSVRVQDLTIAYDYGRGLPQVGGFETRQHFGLDINNIQLGPVQLGFGGYIVEGSPSGFGYHIELGVETRNLQFFAKYEYDNNGVFMRPGYSTEESFLTFGIRINPD